VTDDLRLVGIETVPSYPLLGAAGLYNVAPPDMLVDGLIVAGAITGITSYPGVGKTWFALELASAVSTGRPFLGRFDVRRRPILFVGADASFPDYAQQWRKLTQAAYSEALSAGEENPYEHTKFLIQTDFTFDQREHIVRLIRTANEYQWTHDRYEIVQTDEGEREELVPGARGFGLIVFDTLSKLTHANQNDNTEMENVFRNIRLIAEKTGAAILLLHHNSKRSEYNSGEDWRGAMSQIGALDGWFQLSKKKDNHIQLTIQKFRGLTPEPFWYTLEVDEVSAALKVAEEPSEVAFDDGVESAVVTWLAADGQRGMAFTTTDIAKAIWESVNLVHPDERKFRSALGRRLERMAQGLEPALIKSGGGRQAVPYKWQLNLAWYAAQQKETE
jgi:hypothetical protein